MAGTKDQKYLILLAGLPCTGKSTVSDKLYHGLKDYDLISQNEIRREYGYKKMPKNQDFALRETDRRAAKSLNGGRGVIIDSVNKFTFRRQQVYGVASCCDSRAITLECICSQEEAKKRMRSRPNSDGLISDPNDPRVYDKLSKEWESIDEDFKHLGVDHVSHVTYDSSENALEIVRVDKNNKKLIRFIDRIEKLLIS